MEHGERWRGKFGAIDHAILISILGLGLGAARRGGWSGRATLAARARAGWRTTGRRATGATGAATAMPAFALPFLPRAALMHQHLLHGFGRDRPIAI